MKNKYKKIQMIALLAFVVLVMTGCVSYDSNGMPSGWVYELIGRPTVAILNWLADIFGGSYGIAIIIVTIITRLFMMPSSINMTKNSMISQAKMKIAQPEIDEIREEMEATDDPQLKAELNNEMTNVYKKYDINMFGGFSGCLPLLIQLPFISAVYAAIRSSNEIASSSFLSISLGETSLVLTLIVALTYFIQGWLTTKNTPQSDNPQAQQTSRMMLIMNPLMLGWITYSSNAGLGLYFLTGGVFAIIQQLYTNKIVKPEIEKVIAEEEKKYANVKRTPRSPRKKAVTTKASGDQRLVPTKKQVGNRNAGKQNRK